MKDRVAKTVTKWWNVWEKHPTRLWMFSVLGLSAICWVAFLWHLGSTGLVDETEPLFAEAARQMTVTGDWITPYFNGETRFDKPPLVYWLMAIGYKLIGVNEWAVRLPSAMSAIALTVLGFYTLRYFGISRPSTLIHDNSSELEDAPKLPNPERQRWLSAGIGAALIAFNPITLVWARTGVSDMLLSGCMGTALLSFFIAYVQGETRRQGDGEQNSRYRGNAKGDPQPILGFASGWYLAFYILIALAILAKGPVGIVLPGLIIGAFLVYLGNFWQVVREMRLFWGLGVIGVLAIPWYVLVTLANGEDYINKFFGYHNIERFVGVVNHHWAPWYFYFLVVLVGFAPWSCYLPLAIARLRFWQVQQWRCSPRASQLGLFALCWFAGVFGFFTIAVTKLPSYVLPLMPAAAILVALLASDLLTYQNPQPRLGLRLSGGFNVILLLVLAGAILYSPNIVGYDPAALNLSETLQASGLPLRGGIVWGMAAVATAIALWQRRGWRWLGMINLVAFVAFIILVVSPAAFLLDQQRQLPLRELSAIAAEVNQPSEELLMMGFEKPSVVFYAQRSVNYFDEEHKLIAYIEKIAKTKPNPPSTLILIESKRFNKLQENWLKPNEYTIIDNEGAYHLIRVAKQLVAQKPQPSGER
ncbi:MAG: glycosyltransferase family 39 protein [Coleofasciculus sp. G1-WW12-02]|uniref:ArnT family glycosyltransferase n=1 Tax=Coleofasciculus sp. G1-WW12-02 TaxID=3068483 RepID=UPI0032FA9E04